MAPFPCLLQAISLLLLFALLIFQKFKVLLCPSVFIVRGTHLVCLGFCRDETLPVLFSEVKLSLHFHSESCSCIHPKHRGLECRQQGPPADAGPGLDHTAAQQFSPAGSSPPLRVPGAESCGGGGLSGRICPQPLPCWRVQGWDSSAQGLPNSWGGAGTTEGQWAFGNCGSGSPQP